METLDEFFVLFHAGALKLFCYRENAFFFDQLDLNRLLNAKYFAGTRALQYNLFYFFFQPGDIRKFRNIVNFL